MKKVIVIYDDSRIPKQEIRDITGKNSFGSTIFKRISLMDRMKDASMSIRLCSDFMTDKDFEERQCVGESFSSVTCFVVFSDFSLSDKKAYELLIEKAGYAKDPYKIVENGRICALILPDENSLDLYRRNDFDTMLAIENEAFFDLSASDNFRQYITSGFDARFFNALSGDEYTVIKSSENKAKIKAEYDYYHLLPDAMKSWFVLPYNYREDDSRAYYSMERYHMTDLAIRYVHGAIDEEEFRGILKRIFTFVSSRYEKQISREEYDRATNLLYVEKLNSRIEQLKSLPQFARLEKLISDATDYSGIDDIVGKYLGLYKAITSEKDFVPVLVISHGDLCFSNILYSSNTSLLRLIDPKGASDEETLYMNPYYDIAKLSHSICGLYDFFNSDLFEISVDDNMKLKLSVDCDNSRYVAIFKEFLNEKGIDYNLIRLYEASLFLSMLPLHIDREKKTLGFVLNAVSILEELEYKYKK